MSPARRRLTLGLVTIVVAIQVGIPLALLFEPRPSRFGWQMYSTLVLPPEASIELEDGTLEPVDVERRIADPRAEIRWAEPLARVLCADTAAVAVVVSDHYGTIRVPCP